MTTWLRRLWHLINRPRFERDLTREMREHRDMMHDSSKFGDPHRHLERSRDVWGWNWLDDAMQDSRIGVRALRRAPVFVITAVLILAFGVGLNLTLYQMANVGLLRGPNIREPGTLARFNRRSPSTYRRTVPYPLAQEVGRQSSVLTAILLESSTAITWGTEQNGIGASFVTPNWFTELGGTAAVGRTLSVELDSSSSAPVAVVSHQFWRSRLGADPAIVGSTVLVNRKPVTIVGVTSREFAGVALNQPSVWLVLDQREYFLPDSPFLRTWEWGGLTGGATLFGRLKPGISTAAARESMRGLMAVLHADHPKEVGADEWLEPALATVNFLDERERPRILGALSLLGVLTILVMIVAAANVGNLVLSRATGRSRELGVRIALGARRSRIVRQLMIETLPLAMLGAAGGILLANWAASTIAALGDVADNITFAPDWRTMIVSLVLSVVTLLVIGAVPAWKVTREGLIGAIKDGGQQVSINLDKARIRRIMMAAQVCGSCVILVISAMMTRTLQRVLSDELGFEYEQAAVLEPALDRYGYTPSGAANYWREVKSRVEQDPEAEGVALTLAPPLGNRVTEDHYDDAPGLDVIANRVDPSFFAVMKIPIVAGRTFLANDDPISTVIVGRQLALAMYGTLDVLGRGFPKSKPSETIVGVAGDAHSIRVESVDSSEAYRPLTEADYLRAALVVRARGDAAALPAVLRQAAGIDSRIQPGVYLLRDSFERRVLGTRIASGIAVSTGLLTLAIACLGIFGVVSYGATLRLKEFGIHLALGASRASLVRLIARHVAGPIAIGIILGVAAARPIGRALTSGPIQLQANDPAAYAGAVVLFVLAALAAATLPAIRILKSDPIESLRQS
jgi:putative ABC transport system permease protein